jgi:hypothetical protein
MSGKTLLPDYRPPGGRETPPRLNELLREIDPTAELIYSGAGTWILGSVRPNQVTTKKAERMIDTILTIMALANNGSVAVPANVKKTLAFRLWRYELWRQGFRPIATHKIGQGEPGSWIVEDFRLRDALYHRDFEAQLMARESEADMDEADDKRMEEFRDYLKLMHKDLHSTIIRDRRSVVVDGFKPGRMTA